MAVRLSDDTRRWPDTKIAFDIANDLPNRQRVMDGLAIIERHLPDFRFSQRRNEAAYLHFIRSDHCQTKIGYHGKGAHVIELADQCGTGSVLHEIMHALGFAHEQCRIDRDSYVQIEWGRIQTGKEHNFKKVPEADYVDVGDYDYLSIMHYGAYAFATVLLPTLVTRNSLYSGLIGQQNLSGGDIAAVTAWYGVKKANIILSNNSHATLYVWIRWGRTVWKLHDTLLKPGDTYDFRDDDPDAQFAIGFKAVDKQPIFQFDYVPLRSVVTVSQYNPSDSSTASGLAAGWALQP